MTITLINNRFVKKSEAKISIYSNSFQRGFGVFETLRTYASKQLFHPEKHIERLVKSAKTINLKLKYSKTAIYEMLKRAVAKSTHQIQRIKIIATEESIIISTVPLKENNRLKRGVTIKSIICQRSLPEVKSISYLPSYLSHEQASKYGYYDALLIDKKGEVYEGAYSNIFWFEDNILCTRKEDILKGITRDIVLKLSPFKITFKNIQLKDLKKKKEVFLTQSTSGILPIIKIDDDKIGKGEPGPNTIMLISKFNEALPK